MRPVPECKAYPLASAPQYGRWFAAGAASLAMATSVGVLLRPVIELWEMACGVGLMALLWALALLLRVMGFRLNRHIADCYDGVVAQVTQEWWAGHRQQVALVETVLLGPGCSAPAHLQRLFDPTATAPLAEDSGAGAALRVLPVMGQGSEEREKELARLLVLQWRQQAPGLVELDPLRCYWQGSPDAWQVFVQQMAISFPQVKLPEQPEAWSGITTLNTIIDQVQHAPAHTRILCVGCESTVPAHGGVRPAGEAAVLWLLAPQGRVRFLRGEWFTPETAPLVTVADRALRQAQLKEPPTVCVASSRVQRALRDAVQWNLRPELLDTHFGELPHLGPMVVQTLAASYATQHGAPCAWLAGDPHYTLALGVVHTNDSTH